MRNNQDRWLPPGISLADERKVFLMGLIAASILSVVLFQLHYVQAREPLFRVIRSGAKTVHTVIPGTTIADLGLILRYVFAPLFLLMLCMPILAAAHYLYYRRGSMSIYLMRRLPDKTLLHRQCLTLPLLGLLICVAATLVLFLVYALVYIYATPAQCLPTLYRRFLP